MRKRLKPQLNIEIDRDLFEGLEAACAASFISKAAFVRQAIAEKIMKMESAKRKDENENAATQSVPPAVAGG